MFRAQGGDWSDKRRPFAITTLTVVTLISLVYLSAAWLLLPTGVRQVRWRVEMSTLMASLSALQCAAIHAGIALCVQGGVVKTGSAKAPCTLVRLVPICPTQAVQVHGVSAQ
jgi:hypothetical protein